MDKRVVYRFEYPESGYQEAFRGSCSGMSAVNVCACFQGFVAPDATDEEVIAWFDYAIDRTRFAMTYVSVSSRIIRVPWNHPLLRHEPQRLLWQQGLPTTVREPLMKMIGAYLAAVEEDLAVGGALGPAHNFPEVGYNRMCALARARLDNAEIQRLLKEFNDARGEFIEAHPEAHNIASSLRA